jgi:1-acyl-sn-glycerol-3-phosphate acyltransferase
MNTSTKTSQIDDKVIYKYIPLFFQTIIYIVSLIIFKIFAGFKVYGLDNIKNVKGPVIFAANHSSEWDGILTGVALPFMNHFFPIYYVAMNKHEYINSGWRNYIYGGKFFQFVGAYPRYSGKKNYAYSLHNFVKIINRGGSVCIFPEGKRTEDGSIGEAHGGVAFLSHKTNVPIIPVGISGLVNLKLSDIIFRRRKVRISFGTPIPTQKLIDRIKPYPKDYRKGAEVVMDSVKSLLYNIPLYDKHKELPGTPFYFFLIGKIVGPVVKMIWIKKVHGLENIPKKGAAIVALNHQSYFDFLCLLSVAPRNIHFLSAEKFFQSKLWRPLMITTGQIRVDRSNPDKRMSHASIHHHLRTGRLIGIFPEGTRSENPVDMRYAYTGISKYALKNHVPVIPVGIKGAYNIMSKQDKIPKFNKLVEIYVGGPREFPEFAFIKPNKKAHRLITDKMMIQISSLSGKNYPYVGKPKPKHEKIGNN